MKNIDYYEFLQISPRADQETIHRVYRFLALRYHPDNPESGNGETFSTLTAAYEVLADPARRAEYDIAREQQEPHREPLSSSIDFMDAVAGELNRRLAVLAVLYFRRRTNPLYPEVSLAEIETRMGFPRDYLDFTMWYLAKKGYITRADNSDFTLTAPGVDFVETQRVNIPVLNRLLTGGTESSATDAAPERLLSRSSDPRMIVLPDMTVIQDRRANPRERRSKTQKRQLVTGDRKSPENEF
ncbi:MAG TPA: J domain-containing protein [Silvibacterium sp.]|nr:J domain-containing protein [Silvibacterium sp.]